MLIAFALLYFPILKINELNILDRSIVSTILSLLISTFLQILAVVYRQVVIHLLPTRRPSSIQSQSYFIVITTVIFHFLFYLVVPVSYYILIDVIPKNIKLKQLFIAILMFLAMVIIIAILDIKHRIFNSRRKKILSKWS
jgi:hypothetical protein